MPEWDYFLAYLDTSMGPSAVQRTFVELGQKGWELVSVIPIPHEPGAAGLQFVAFFKRPLTDSKG